MLDPLQHVDELVGSPAVFVSFGDTAPILNLTGDPLYSYYEMHIRQTLPAYLPWMVTFGSRAVVQYGQKLEAVGMKSHDSKKEWQRCSMYESNALQRLQPAVCDIWINSS